MNKTLAQVILFTTCVVATVVAIITGMSSAVVLALMSGLFGLQQRYGE